MRRRRQETESDAELATSERLNTQRKSVSMANAQCACARDAGGHQDVGELDWLDFRNGPARYVGA